MRITPQVIKDAQRWVTAINKYFHIKQKIVVQKGTDKNKMNWFAITTLPVDPKAIITIDLYPNRDKRNISLFQVMYHEMTHILLWPLTQGNPEGGALDKVEERVVQSLELIMKKVSERK